MSNEDIVFNRRNLVKNSPLLRCYCNDGGNCLRNKTCETDGFCYQRIVIQSKNGKSIKQIVKGCSSSKQLDFYYCTHSSNKTNLKCCSNDFCNNQQMDISHYNLRQLLNFSLFMLLVIVMVIVVTLLIRKFIKRRKVKKRKADIENARNSNKPKLYNQLEFVRQVKKGEFIHSFYGRRLGEKLFIKIFDRKVKQNWLNEVEVFSLPLIRHESIADFVGKDHLLIVTIYYEIGSLTNYLKNNRDLNEDQMLRLMLTAAQGLDHLHQDLDFKPSIVHRNLNSNNFLVVAGDVLKCKLTDFSHALTYTRYEKLAFEQNLKQLKTIVCDHRYCPPEYFNQNIDCKNFLALQAADTYSFSLILWQIANHQADNLAFNNVDQSAGQELFEQSIKLNSLDQFDESNLNVPATTDQFGPDGNRNLNQKLDCVDSDHEDHMDLGQKKEMNEFDPLQDKISQQSSHKISSHKDTEDDTLSQINSIRDQMNNILESRYLKPYEEYLTHDGKKSEYVQMKELLIEDSFLTRPTIYFDAKKIKTFNVYVIPKLIDESWSFEPSARLSIERIVKDLNNLFNIHLKNINKN